MRRTSAAFFLFGAFAAASCGACRQTEKPAHRPLIFGTVEEPDTLDPVFTEVAGAAEIVRLVYRDLTTFDDRWQLVPELAAALPEVSTSSTSTTGAPHVVWTLKPNLAWSDGHPLTTRDLLFGYRIASDPKLESNSKQMTDEIAKMAARSPLELVVDWRQAYPGYQTMRVHPFLPEHAYPDPKTTAAPFRGAGRNPLSNGPYRVKSWAPGQHLTLEPNPHWSGSAPHISAIVFRFFKSEDAFEAELATGGIDALGEASGLALERAEGLAQRLAKTHAVEYTESGLLLHMAARADDPATGDPDVRRAIALAIDRSVMAKVVYGGRATPAYGCFPPRHPAHQNDLAALYDVDEAKRLLRGRKIALKMQFASGSQTSERAAAFVQAELKKIGIDIELESMPLRALFGKMREKKHAPLAMFAWRSAPDWDAFAMLHSTGAQNYGGFKDAELDRLLDHAKHEVDPHRWVEFLGEVEKRYNALLPTIPLLFRQAVSVRPIDLEGWRPTGTITPVTWNAEAWRWKNE